MKVLVAVKRVIDANVKVRVKADLMRGWLMYVIPWEVSTRWREARVQTVEAAP